MKYLLHGAVLLLSAFSLLWRLDGTVLWRDEATTASWAREMVERRTLLPRVFDGERLIAQAPDGHDFNDRFLPAMQGWLQFYVGALGFLVAAPGTVSARLPFVLAGAAALWMLYRVGRELFEESAWALALPLSGATSIYFLTAARQARYYILVVLFTSLILLELVRYLREPARAGRWGFWLRLGLYGLLMFLANYVSFGGLWASLAVFVLLARDRALLGRFVGVSAAVGLVAAAPYRLLHAEFVAGSLAAQPTVWAQWTELIDYHATELFRLLPLAALVPAAWFVFVRRRERGPRAGAALLAAVIVVVSVAATIAAAKTGAISRYYFQIVPAALLLVAILAERLAALAGRGWAGLFLGACLAWPNINVYHAWCVHAVERQFTRDTNDKVIVDFLRDNVARHETVAFHRNVQGIMVYFNLPWLRWVALLDADEPRNRRLRGKLPDNLFDDWDGADWYVVWDDRDRMPRKLTADYQLVWEHSYLEPRSWWDRRSPERLLRYRVYRRAGGSTRR